MSARLPAFGLLLLFSPNFEYLLHCVTPNTEASGTINFLKSTFAFKVPLHRHITFSFYFTFIHFILHLLLSGDFLISHLLPRNYCGQLSPQTTFCPATCWGFSLYSPLADVGNQHTYRDSFPLIISVRL